MGSYGQKAERAMSYSAIERTVATVRSKTIPHVSLTGAVPSIALFQGLRQFWVSTAAGPVRLDYEVADMPPAIEGQTYFDKDEKRIVIALSAPTYRALEDETPRARFSVCHELGHAVLHPNIVIQKASMPHVKPSLQRVRTEHPSYEDTEWQANAFAAAMLMPAKGLDRLMRQHGQLTESELQMVYGVSLQAAEIRLSLFKSKRSVLLNP